MNNKKLFQEAIAEAKSIREAAIANAKEALEESLTPQIKSLLAQRLTEMEEEEEDLDESLLDQPPVMEEEEEESGEEAGEESAEEEEGAEEAGEESEEESEEEAGEESEEIEDMSVEELKDLIRDIVGQMVDSGEGQANDMGGEDLGGSMEPEMGLEEPMGDEAPEDEEIDLDELLAELSEEEEEDKKEEAVTEVNSGYDPSNAAAAGLQNLVSGFKSLIQQGGPIAQQAYSELQKLGGAAAMGLREGVETSEVKKVLKAFDGVKSELTEAKKTIKQLSENLKEVNLLNAKLLFINKIFKANPNLSESQIANVITTFDKATTSKEAKLVYESFVTTLTKKSNATVVESKLKGFASKPAGAAPAKTEVITEVSEAVKRMQKLAGIIKG